jgi:predicted transcriptional regulator
MSESKHRVSAIYPSIRAAVAILLAQDKYDVAAAARGAGLTLNKLKEYLARPSVRSYFREQRRIQIETLCASNANALARVRDEGENAMAIVNAVRQAETMRQRIVEEDGPTGMARPSAGLVIVIGRDAGRDVRVEPRLAGAPRVLEAAAFERGPDPDDDFLVDNSGDEVVDVLPPPVRAPVKPVVRRKSPSAAKARQ